MLHFRSWARNETEEFQTILVERRFKAQVKASSVVVASLACCWYFDFSFWIMVGMVLGIGMVAAFAGIDVAAMPLLAAGFMLREWAFGFPTLVLHTLPPRKLDDHFDTTLVGVEAVAISPLRPFGRIQLGDQTLDAVSESGTMIDSGTRVRITGCRNGVIQVQAVME
ncbi:MAG: NfeD family protein [Pirellulales bacterium]